jgi:hypothetical protein
MLIMARLQGPLHAEAAAGTLAGCLIYSSWRGRPYVKRYVVPRQPNTPAQLANQARFTAANDAWHDLTPEEQAAWESRGAPDNLPAYHAFMRAYTRAKE